MYEKFICLTLSYYQVTTLADVSQVIVVDVVVDIVVDIVDDI